MFLLLQILFVMFAAVFIPIGLLMMFAPSRYPKLYGGFLSQKVIQREKTEAGRMLAIRVQGLCYLFMGVMIGVFLWAMA